jgi:hypothetical protein
MSYKVEFCEICHKPAYAIITEGENVKIVQKGKTVMNTKAGSSLNIGSFSCPDGHPNKLNLKGDKEMTTGNAPKSPEELKKEMMAKAGMPPMDPNAGKRMMLEAQIKGLTGARDAQQKSVDGLTARITDLQAQLSVLPPAPAK